jgi:hypothetical protein
MIWSTTRGLRRGRTTSAEIADDVVALLLHGCITATNAAAVARTGEPDRWST